VWYFYFLNRISGQDRSFNEKPQQRSEADNVCAENRNGGLMLLMLVPKTTIVV
jgi:hypothetical protein